MPKWAWLFGATAVVAIVVASLIPAKLQLRTGLPALPPPRLLASPLHGPSSWPDLMVSAALLKARHGSEEKPGIGQNPGLNWVLAQPEEI